ncbi:hypothetical protein HPP92_011247 [Vanilla planifolia]|uniref:NAC domain-containing protein n=1 Tax=Vanilla planifolia TaxID=51239 RepID=A0A835R1H9_VANPL|nr:hypothetical protein HPP92_011247 [Vanilla planifolia]
MEEKLDMDKVDEIMLPGFRFHPTDEELVGFYLKRKIQQKPLSIELIRQLDIYKYDPWDLPKLATTGEKEWYFYCPRDRKYRNSARPNRVTGSGFWKATGTDRPIYSTEGTKCIGLKKSLVFYKGRAAKGVKTDWMMHEFRLPSLNDPTSVSKRPLEKNVIPANESWAICRIFKKTNTSAQRALAHSWMSNSTLSEAAHFGSENISCTTEVGSSLQFGAIEQQAYPTLGNPMPTNFMFSMPETSMLPKPSVDMAALFLNLAPDMLQDVEKRSPSIDFGQPHQFTVTFPLEANGSLATEEEDMIGKKNVNGSTIISNGQWGNFRNMSFPFNLAANASEEWKQSLPWDSALCPSEMSTGYSTNKCYT